MRAVRWIVPAVAANFIVEPPDRLITRRRRRARGGQPLGLLAHAEEGDLRAGIAEEFAQSFDAAARGAVEVGRHGRRDFDAGAFEAQVGEQLRRQLGILGDAMLFADAEELRRTALAQQLVVARP